MPPYKEKGEKYITLGRNAEGSVVVMQIGVGSHIDRPNDCGAVGGWGTTGELNDNGQKQGRPEKPTTPTATLEQTGGIDTAQTLAGKPMGDARADLDQAADEENQPTDPCRGFLECLKPSNIDQTRLQDITVTASEETKQAARNYGPMFVVPEQQAKNEILKYLAEGDSGAIYITSGNAGAKYGSSSGDLDYGRGKPPGNTAAIIHGHIPGKSDGLVDSLKAGYQGDAQTLLTSTPRPNFTVYEGRIGVHEVVGGVVTFTMVQGSMTSHERTEIQRNLDKQQRFFYAK
jgi:hypothetical protein